MWTRVNDIDRMYGAMDLLRSRMNRLFADFDRPLDEGYGWKVVNGYPKTNLYDEGSRFLFVAELPGISKEDLTIRIQGNYLELSGTRKSDTPEGYKTHRVERGASSFTRSFTLPVDVDSSGVEATLKDGILNVVLPKAEAAKPRQITIR
jgi:HSP20 family protein